MFTKCMGKKRARTDEQRTFISAQAKRRVKETEREREGERERERKREK